jgi:cell division protein FtsQ
MAKRHQEEKNRAEKVRTRRQRSPETNQVNPFGNSATRKKTSYKSPVTRRKISTMPVVNRQRRKVNVPLKSKGAELQLPAFPRIQLGWRLISGAVFLLSLFVIISFLSFSTFKVSAITLDGAERLSKETLLSQLDLMGMPILKVKPKELQTFVEETFPGLSSVQVSIGLPASVSIQVKERHPLILWQQENHAYWIDAEGVIFPLRGEVEVPLTVIANSDPPSASINEEQGSAEDTENEDLKTDVESNSPIITRTTPTFVQGILALTEYIPQDSFLQYDPEFGLGWQDPRGWLVYFGKDTMDIELKLAEYETIVATLTEKNLAPSLISLEFINAPFYRLE